MDLSDYNPDDPLPRAHTIPARWYIDPAFLANERERVFGHTWQPVGRATDVHNRGDWFACDIVGEPVIVARAKSGELHAFSNVCRHRASLVAEGTGHSFSLRCPYHSWTYSLEGNLLTQPEFEGVEDWNKEAVCLPRYRVETWGPFVFVNLSDSAPPFAEFFGRIPQEVAAIGCDIENLFRVERRDYVINCNWKVYIDNYLEGYHLPTAHPGLYKLVDYKQYRVDTDRYYSSQYSPLRGGQEGQALYYWIFPNFMLNIYPNNISSNIILPLGHDRTLTVFEWFAFGDTSYLPAGAIEFSDEIQQEDIKICEMVQRGLASRTYTRGRLSVKRENGVHHFHRLLHEFLSAAPSGPRG